MIRKIIKIDEDKCNGCGLCAKACHEGAIGMVNGKAKLLRDDYCDGLGDCLPVCPTNAITFVEREAAAYDEAAVKARQQQLRQHGGGCPGSKAFTIQKDCAAPHCSGAVQQESELRQWPVQIKLVSVTAPYFEHADLLIAADCTAFAYGSLHSEFMKGKVVLIGCPKLDDGDYSEKLAAIFAANDIQSVQVVRMEVPCCGGIVSAVESALEKSGKSIPLSIATISIDGRRLD